MSAGTGLPPFLINCLCFYHVLQLYLSCLYSINRSFARYYGNTVPHLLLIANNQKPKLEVAFKQCFSLGIVNLFYCFHTGCLIKCRFSGNIKVTQKGCQCSPTSRWSRPLFSRNPKEERPTREWESPTWTRTPEWTPKMNFCKTPTFSFNLWEESEFEAEESSGEPTLGPWALCKSPLRGVAFKTSGRD